MRKMLILMLILGVVSIASAMSLQISVNGDANLTPHLVTLQPSETAELDVWTPDGYIPGGPDDKYWALVVLNNYEGTITLDSGRCLMPPAPDLSSLLPSEWDEVFPGNGGVFGAIASGAGVVAPAGIYFDQIIFHCDSPHDVTLQLWSDLLTEGSLPVLEDSVIIHQIPEPATLFLLSLGGLLFRKRGK